MAERNINELFERYLSGQCNAEEIAQLYAHFGVRENRALLKDRIAQMLSHREDAPRAMVYRAQQIADRVGIRLHEHVTNNRSNLWPRRLRWLPHVAAAIVLLAIGWWGIGNQIFRDGERSLHSNVTDIAPGTNRATLTLADGRTIDLSEVQAGIVIGDEIRYSDGSEVLASEISESVSPEDSRHSERTTNDLQLTTPKGGTYQITLPDGSRVWLNAASTLSYPSRFSDDERVVFLEGEAFFEISKQVSKRTSEQLRFKVITDGQIVEVLGTGFNISAYADEAETKTTLAEGSVKVSNLQSNDSKLLMPGQQTAIRGSHMEIRQVDVNQHTAWKSGRFHFNRTPFSDMISQLARWYDVEVVYRRGVPNETFSGKMGRELSLKEMLGLMDISDAVIRLEGRTLVVQ